MQLCVYTLRGWTSNRPSRRKPVENARAVNRQKRRVHLMIIKFTRAHSWNNNWRRKEPNAIDLKAMSRRFSTPRSHFVAWIIIVNPMMSSSVRIACVFNAQRIAIVELFPFLIHDRRKRFSLWRIFELFAAEATAGANNEMQPYNF